MIQYALACDKGHTFESWFQNSAAYDKQVKRKLIECPLCGSAKVEKAIMAPRLARRDKSTSIAVREDMAREDMAREDLAQAEAAAADRRVLRPRHPGPSSTFPPWRNCKPGR